MTMTYIMIGAVIGALTMGFVCEEKFVQMMNEVERLREKLNEPKINTMSIEIDYNNNENLWRV